MKKLWFWILRQIVWNGLRPFQTIWHKIQCCYSSQKKIKFNIKASLYTLTLSSPALVRASCTGYILFLLFEMISYKSKNDDYKGLVSSYMQSWTESQDPIINMPGRRLHSSFNSSYFAHYITILIIRLIMKCQSSWLAKEFISSFKLCHQF